MFSFLLCTANICSLAFTSGGGTTICLSNLPGLNKALSIHQVCLLLLVRLHLHLLRIHPFQPTFGLMFVLFHHVLHQFRLLFDVLLHQFSSINIIQVHFFFASWNKSLTLDAPTPTYISTKSEPLIKRMVLQLLPATAFLLIKVLPVPGCPTNNTPFEFLLPYL